MVSSIIKTMVVGLWAVFAIVMMLLGATATMGMIFNRAVIVQPWSITITADLSRHPAIAERLAIESLKDD